MNTDYTATYTDTAAPDWWSCHIQHRGGAEQTVGVFKTRIYKSYLQSEFEKNVCYFPVRHMLNVIMQIYSNRFLILRCYPYEVEADLTNSSGSVVDLRSYLAVADKITYVTHISFHLQKVLNTIFQAKDQLQGNMRWGIV